MANIAYISLTGMTEPLGESQVLQYLLSLAQENNIYLLSFEKSTEKTKYQEIAKRLADANIQWKYYEYSNRLGIFSTCWQIILGYFFLNKILKQYNIEIIHARSLVAAVIGAVLKRFNKVKLIFDIRGFAIDEKIMEGRLKEKSFLTWILKKIEASIYKNANHVVTLTHISKPIIKTLYGVDDLKITVIPTCANLKVFKCLSETEKSNLRKDHGYNVDDFIVLHSGSLNAGVDFEGELKIFASLKRLNPRAKFLILNKGQHELIKSYLSKFNVDPTDYKIYEVEFDKMFYFLNIADICVFFIKPTFAKQASAPTKFAEIVACNLYSVTNTKYGDLEFYLSQYPLGVLLDLNEVHSSTEDAAKKILQGFLHHANNKTELSQKLFNEHFSKMIAVQKYQIIYDQLRKET